MLDAETNNPNDQTADQETATNDKAHAKEAKKSDSEKFLEQMKMFKQWFEKTPLWADPSKLLLQYDEKENVLCEKGCRKKLDCDLFNMNDWIQNDATLHSIVPAKEIRNGGDLFHTASVRMSLDKFAIFTHRAIGGSNQMYRPDVNHRKVWLTNITAGIKSGKPGMIHTAGEASADVDFGANKVGIIFYSVVLSDEDTGGRSKFPLQTFSKVLGEAKNIGAKTNAKKVERKDIMILDGEHACQPNADEFNSLMKYFSIPVQDIDRDPNPGDYDEFFRIMNEYKLDTVQSITQFVDQRGIPLFVEGGEDYYQLRHMLTVHYQMHCRVRMAACEGSHRIYTAVVTTERINPSLQLPCVPGEAPDIQIPTGSALFRTLNVDIAASISGKHTGVFFESLKQEGKKITQGLTHAVSPTIRSFWSKAINEAELRLEQLMIDHNGAAFLREQQRNKDEHSDYYNFRAECIDALLPHAMDDIYLKTDMDNWKNRTGKSDDEILKLLKTNNRYNSFLGSANPKAASNKLFPTTYPRDLLVIMEAATFGMITSKAVDVFAGFIDEPTWTEQNEPTIDMHTTAFMKDLVLFVGYVADKIYNHAKNQDRFPTHMKGCLAGKLKLLIKHNVYMDVMTAINTFGPNPVIQDVEQPLAKLVR